MRTMDVRHAGATAGAVPGPATGELRRLYLRWTAAGRVVLGIGTVLFALVGAPRSQLPATALAAAVLIPWSLLYGRVVMTRVPAWLVLTDTALLTALCLVQRSVVPPSLVEESGNWVIVLLGVAVVVTQWATPPLAGAVVAVVLSSAFVLGSRGGFVGEPVRLYELWLLVMAAESRGLVWMVARAGGLADRVIAHEAEGRAAAAVAAARRADERAHLAQLHDTAAATLLMVGMGAVRGDPPWLRDQAARDVAVLRGTADAPAGDLVEQVRAVVAESSLDVRLRFDGAGDGLPPAAAAALAAALREALTNVARHAGVGEADVQVRASGGRAAVEVRDGGCGFEQGATPEGRWGIADSIVGRMEALGGRATVEARPGEGTRVLLEWPRG